MTAKNIRSQKTYRITPMISNFRVNGDETGIGKPGSDDGTTGWKQASPAPKTIPTGRENKSKSIKSAIIFGLFYKRYCTAEDI